MRFLIAFAAALTTCALLGACAGYRFPGVPAPGTGTVSGRVSVVPCAPVEKVGAPCQGKAAPNIALIFTSSGNEQVIAQTDTAGSYSVELTAGRWAVAIKGYGIGSQNKEGPVTRALLSLRVISGPSTVTVEAGGRVVANYVVDSGIRLPGPAAGSSSPPSD